MLIREFDVHDCMDQPIPAPRCSLGSTAFEMELLDLLIELGPTLIKPPGLDAISGHQRGDARGLLNEPVHAMYTIQLGTALIAAQLAASESKDTHRTASTRRCSLS